MRIKRYLLNLVHVPFKDAMENRNTIALSIFSFLIADLSKMLFIWQNENEAGKNPKLK